MTEKDKKEEVMAQKILIFGGSGPTGVQFIRHALKSGHTVTAYVRSPAKLAQDIKHDRLIVKKGELADDKAVDEVMAGQAAVISCLGVHGTKPWNKTDLYTTSMKTIMSSMDKAGVKRIVCMTSIGVEKPAKPIGSLMMRWMFSPFQWMCSGFLENMRAMEKMVEASNLDYTIVRPPGLADGAGKGVDAIQAEEGFWLEGGSMMTDRADVAAFMLHCFNKNLWVKKGVSIGYRANK